MEQPIPIASKQDFGDQISADFKDNLNLDTKVKQGSTPKKQIRKTRLSAPIRTPKGKDAAPIKEPTPVKQVKTPSKKPDWDFTVPRPFEKSKTNLTPHPSRVSGPVNQLRGRSPPSKPCFNASPAADHQESKWKMLYMEEQEKTKALQLQIQELQQQLELAMDLAPIKSQK